MFEKIWWPDEGMDHLVLLAGPVIVLIPIGALVFLLSFVSPLLGYWSGMILFGLVFLLGGIITVRCAMTLELDKESAEKIRSHMARRKKVVAWFGFFMVILLSGGVWLLPQFVGPVLPMIVPSLFLLLLGMAGISPKAVVVATSIVTLPVVLLAGLVFSWSWAFYSGGVILLFIFPVSLASAIKTERFLIGDLERKLPPSMTKNLIVQ